MVQAVNKLRECHSVAQFQLQNSALQFLFQAQLHLCVLLAAQSGSKASLTAAGQMESRI
jgi:hypothetical protein